MYSEKYICILSYMLFQQAVHEIYVLKIHVKTSEPEPLFQKASSLQFY